MFERLTKREKKEKRGQRNAKNSKPCKPWRCTHTHTHTSTFREIKRVANEAALFGVGDRLFVALYERKNKVLEIACFLRANFIGYIMKKLFCTNTDIVGNIAKVGGVE